MRFLTSLRQRRRQPEIIDEPDLPPDRLHRALVGLERINWWSGSARILWPAVHAEAMQARPRPLSVLDIATGAGDIPIRLWRKARRAGLLLQLSGCDRNPVAVAHGRRRALEVEAPIHFFEWDIWQDISPGEFDIVTCSLFLHHLDGDQAITFLRRMAASARCAVLVNDLVRSPAAFALAYVGTRVLSRSAMVHTDGPRSVQGAFTLEEVRGLACRAGLEGAVVAARWPCRLLLSWHRAARIPSGERT
jgi:2-polyprenyl-3-methyl-5-hydroxy-6-metoxy-1,4-benzoquinol methylase